MLTPGGVIQTAICFYELNHGAFAPVMTVTNGCQGGDRSTIERHVNKRQGQANQPSELMLSDVNELVEHKMKNSQLPHELHTLVTKLSCIWS